MSEIDPNILKRNLPEDVAKVITDVSANVDAAVKELVGGFKAHANQIADKFEKRQFDGELKTQLDEVQKAFDADLKGISDEIGKIAGLAAAADAAAKAIDTKKLLEATDDLVKKTGAVTEKLVDFRAKTTSFGEKTGGLIAKAAIKAFTGGIG